MHNHPPEILLDPYLGTPPHRVMSAKPYNCPDTAFKHNGNAWHLFVDRTLKSRKSEKEEGD